MLESQEMRFNPWVRKIPWREGMATLQCSCLENPMDKEPGRLQSMRSQRVGHDRSNDWSDLACRHALSRRGYWNLVFFNLKHSIMAQMVKNPPEKGKTWVRSLSWKLPWRRAWQPTPVFLPGEIPVDRGSWRATVHGVIKSQTRLSD